MTVKMNSMEDDDQYIGTSCSPEGAKWSHEGATCIKPDIPWPLQGMTSTELDMHDMILPSDSSCTEQSELSESQNFSAQSLYELSDSVKDQELRHIVVNQETDSSSHMDTLPKDYGYNSMEGGESSVGLITKVYGRQGSDSSSKASINAYKFKNDIKLRFNAAKSTIEKGLECRGGELSSSSSSLSSSSSSMLFKEEFGKDRKVANNNLDYESLSSNYPGSDCSSVGQSSLGSPISLSDKQLWGGATVGQQGLHGQNAGSGVPGFALHPTGTYYIPVVIAMTHILPYLRNGSANDSLGIFHPISIPVSFGSPLLPMQKSMITERSNSGTSVATSKNPHLDINRKLYYKL